MSSGNAIALSYAEASAYDVDRCADMSILYRFSFFFRGRCMNGKRYWFNCQTVLICIDLDCAALL
jgi:hypothetical protein